MSPKASRLLWAVDALEPDAALAGRMRAVVEQWAAALGASIEPVFVMSPRTMRVPAGYFRSHPEDLAAAARERLAAATHPATPALGPPTIVSVDATSLGAAAAALLTHARSHEDFVIAAASHGKGPLERWTLGSFTETLLQRLPPGLPLLLLAPGAAAAPLTSVLAPTDLGAGAKAAVRRVAALAKRLGATLTLLNIPEFLDAHPEASFGPPDAYEAHRLDDLAWRERELKELAAVAARAGVAVKTMLGPPDERPATAILRAAERLRPGLVAMVSHKTRVEAGLLGSETLRVARHAPVPLWVLHGDLES